MLLAFGSNGSGQLGLSHQDDIDVPARTTIPIPLDEPSISPPRISAGGNHTLLLTAAGKVLATGDNSDGRCAFIESERTSSAAFLPAGAPDLCYTHCSATWEASVLVSSSNRVYVCGSGGKGELGLGDSITTSNRLQLVPDFPPVDARIIDIASGVNHAVVILSNGDVYGWGAGRKGQLGEPAVKCCWEPRKIGGIPFRACRVACGREFTIVLGPQDEGHFAILGSDKWAIKSNAPLDVSGWVDLGASWGGIYILLASGRLLAWGRNDHRQLPSKPLEGLSSIAVGSEHVLALTASGQMLSWGWGEHGNCGRLTGQDDFDSDRPEGISLPGPILNLGAGCATSWIYLEEPV